jgi:uracil-DNA glycosylase
MPHLFPRSLAVVSREARACDACAAELPFKPKPIFLAKRTAKLLIVGQAPGRLCYPGTVAGADLPPCAECAPLWQPRFRAALPEIRLTLLVGSYAQAYYLGSSRKKTLGETVRAYREYLPEFFPLPHPSWRNLLWLKRNPWFTKNVIPALRRRIKAL